MRRIAIILTAALALFHGAAAHAQSGNRPLRLVLPYSAGGVGDALARIIAEAMQGRLGRPVIVENKVGAAGRIGVQAVKAAPPDGSVLLFTPIAPMSIYPHVYEQLGYDPSVDFHPVSQVATFDFAAARAPNVRATSLAELVEWLKANPEKATYGTPGAGTLPHLCGVLFGQATGIELRHVPYKGNAPALADLIGGHISLMFTSTQDLVEAHAAGRIGIMATSGASRAPALPEVPTFKEAGIAIEGNGWYGIYAPAGTPADLVARLNALIVSVVGTAAIRSRMLALGLQPTGTSSEDHFRIQQSDSTFWGPVIKASGFQAEP